MFFHDINSIANLVPTKTGSKFLQGKLTISDKSVTELVNKITRCCGLTANIEFFSHSAAQLEKYLAGLYQSGIGIINKKVYLHKNRGRWTINYYNRTYNLRKSFKMKIKAKVIDVENAKFSFAVFFYFDTKEWTHNYRGQSHARNLYIKTSSVNGKRVKDVHRKGGGLMLRPHSYTFPPHGTRGGEARKDYAKHPRPVDIGWIEALDKGFTIGKRGVGKEVKGRDFLSGLNKLADPTAMRSSVEKVGGEYVETITRSMYKNINLPISSVIRDNRATYWTKKATKALKIGDEKTLLSICRNMDKELFEWANNVFEIDESLFRK